MNPENESKTTSHVTAAPEHIPGENYDPQIRAQYANEPHVVPAVREIDTPEFAISEKGQSLHEASVAAYPQLNLSRGEYVILSIKRHPIGMVMPLLAGGSVVLALMVFLMFYPSDAATSGLPDFMTILLVSTLLIVLVALGTCIALWVYLQNRFFLTNESVIQEIQTSLFARHEQTVSLGSIEDASFRKNGILQTLLGYGTLRLSTEGEETTYRFHYVARPREQVATVSNAIEAFKNGRPFDSYDDLK